MADLVTHVCVGLLPAGLSRKIPAGPLVLGAVLPDLGARVPSMGTEALSRALGVEVPGVLLHGWGVLHMPLGTAALALLLSLLFPEEQRSRVLGWILAGAASHYLLDLVQDHHGQGYYLLFPFSLAHWELGWLHSEYSLDLAPWLAGLTALVWAVRGARAWRRRKSSR